MIGEYKLAKIVGKLGNAMFFSHVFVEVKDFDGKNTVIDSTMENPINRGEAEVDTTLDTIRTASALATWKAINPAFPEPYPVFDNGWYVDFH